MKKLFLFLFAVCVAVFLRFGPKVREQCSVICDRMFDSMPDAFPPKRMLKNLEIIKEQNERILQLLEKRGKPSRKQS